MNSDLSTAFSIDDDVSFIYNKIRKADSYVYKADGYDDNHHLDNNDDMDEIIDVKTEKKYSYGIATVYFIVLLFLVNTLLSKVATLRQNKTEDRFLDNYNLMSKEIIKMKQENAIMNHKLRQIEDDFKRKEMEKSIKDELHGRRNLMNYKYGTKLIKEKTSETCNTDSKVLATDLLTHSYMNDNTINWECLYDDYCSLGIHFGKPQLVDRIIYEYGGVVPNIERIKVFYELEEEMVMVDDYLCKNTGDYEIIDIGDKGVHVSDVEIQMYPLDKRGGCLSVNYFMVNVL